MTYKVSAVPVHRGRSSSFHPTTTNLNQIKPRRLKSDLPHQTIESLDLSTSLPLALVSLRQYLIRNLNQVERHIKSITQDLNNPSSSDTEESSSEEDEEDEEEEVPLLSLSKSNTISPIRSFVEQLSIYVQHLKQDLLSSEHQLSINFINPLLPDHTTEFPKLREKLDMMIESMTIRSANQILTNLTIHLESVQEILSQVSLFSNNHQNIQPRSTFSKDSQSHPTPNTNLDSIRDYFISESERLSSLLPQNSITPYLTETLSQAIHTGENYIRNEKEKLKDWVDHETESLRLALQAGASRLLTYHELPEEWKNNRFILSGYRFIPLDRWKELLFSGFQWHNETINIHTHLIGTISLIYLLCFLWPITPHTDPNSSTLMDRMISLIFVGCAIKCLVCSTAWHLFAGCGTLGPFRRLACVDYVGISGLIAASVASAEYYGFYCRPNLATCYIAFTTVMGIIGMILPFQPVFDKPESKGIRIIFFVSMACSALIPQAHMAYLYGIQETVNFYKPGMPSILSYLSGLFFYATNWPERFRPGWIFDTLGSSHQFWHIAIVLAIWLHWRAIGVFHEVGRIGFSCAA